MKTNLTRTLMLTAGMMTLSAAAAYGQSRIVANVPFSFHTYAGQQAPGSYSIGSTNSNGTILWLRNLTNGTLTTVGVGTLVGNGRDLRPRLVFHCGSQSGCSLAEVWNAEGHGHKFPTPHMKAEEVERIAVVFLDQKSAE